MKIYTPKDYNTGELNMLSMEKKHIQKVLKLCRGKRSATALVLGISERTLYNKLISHQID